MDDRFDRRELLLNLGDMLDALSCLARTGTPDMPVVQLAKEQDLFWDLGSLRAIAPKMTVAEFSARVASAFFLWPEKICAHPIAVIVANQRTEQLATEDKPGRSVGHVVEDTFAENDASSAGSVSRIDPRRQIGRPECRGE